MNTPNNAAALERLEQIVSMMAKSAPVHNRAYYLQVPQSDVRDLNKALAELRTLAQPDALTSQPSGEAVGEFVGYGRITGEPHVRMKEGLTPESLLYLHPSADAPGVADDSARLAFLITHEYTVRKMADTGLWMLLSRDGDPITGGEHDTAVEAIDEWMRERALRDAVTAALSPAKENGRE